jgi:uncharacterized protein YggE
MSPGAGRLLSASADPRGTTRTPIGRTPGDGQLVESHEELLRLQAKWCEGGDLLRRYRNRLEKLLATPVTATIRDGSDAASARATSAPSGNALHVTGAATVDLKRRSGRDLVHHARPRGRRWRPAQNHASRAMRAVIAARTARGVAGRDMQTHHQYATRAGRHVAGVRAGAHSSEGPVFSLASTQRGYRAALTAAVKQARSQAAAMAAAAGLRITGVVSIQEDQNDRYAVYGAASGDALAPARVVAVPTRPGRSQVSASVTAVFADAPVA